MVTLAIILSLFLAATLAVAWRGRIRHSLARQITDHSTLLAPVNLIFYAFSAVPNRPYLDRRHFPYLADIEREWETIRDEAVKAFDRAPAGPSHLAHDLGFYSLMKKGWSRFYLSWYGRTLPSAERDCPRTLALLRGIPEIRAAMFALLPPGGRIVAHRDPYAGSLRYHLGLETPNDDRCRIYVDGQPYSWRTGEGVIFDETFIHRALNETDRRRIILFCDIRRPLRPRWLGGFAYFVERLFMSSARSVNEAGESVGALNRVFPAFYRLRRPIKAFKRAHRRSYYSAKFGLLFALAALFLWLF